MRAVKAALKVTTIILFPAVITAKYFSIAVDDAQQTDIFHVGVGEVLVVDTVSWFMSAPQFWIIYGENEPVLIDVLNESDEEDTYVGPFDAYLVGRNYYPDEYEFAFVTFRIEGGESGSIPRITSDAVVIPADAGGEYSILLESSQDLITWNQAIPGDYSGSTEQRFFRVRALRK